MRKTVSAVVVAVALVGAWMVVVVTHARTGAGNDVRIEPFAMMTHASGLPTQTVVDYSVGH
jgi:hypothetical protein